MGNGPLTNGVMMKTTMLIAIGMAALAVITVLEVGTHTARTVHALNHQLQPLQLQQPPLPQLPLALHLDVDPLNGLKINGVMMKTITLIATGMVGLVVTMLLEDGTHIAQIVNV